MDRSETRRWIAGWIAVLVSTAASMLWAFWGSIENFHEGWYFRDLSRNLELAVVQYLPWMFVPMLAALCALSRRWLGVVVHLAFAAGAVALFGWRLSAGMTLIALPLVGLAILYAYGRPTPLRWARTMVVALPMATAVVSGAYPGWRAITRPRVIDPSMRVIAGNGVALVWAPAGPGWNDLGLSWPAAQERCAHLTPDGRSVAPTPQNVWRLPTVDEAVRTMSWRGRNAGGAWDPAAGVAHFRATPDKEAPLWDPFSPVIYWWTADEVDANQAYRVVYNGLVTPLIKKARPAYLSCRCVKNQ